MKNFIRKHRDTIRAYIYGISVLGLLILGLLKTITGETESLISVFALLLILAIEDRINRVLRDIHKFLVSQNDSLHEINLYLLEKLEEKDKD